MRERNRMREFAKKTRNKSLNILVAIFHDSILRDWKQSHRGFFSRKSMPRLLYLIVITLNSAFFFPRQSSASFRPRRTDTGGPRAERGLCGRNNKRLRGLVHYNLLSAKVHLIKRCRNERVSFRYFLRDGSNSSFLARRSPGSHLHSVDSRERANSESPAPGKRQPDRAPSRGC